MRARPQRPRLFSPATPWNTPFPAVQTPIPAGGWEVRTPTGAVRTRCSAYLRQIRRRIRELSVQLAKVVGASASVCACDPVALPRRGSDLLLELRRERKFSSNGCYPTKGRPILYGYLVRMICVTFSPRFANPRNQPAPWISGVTRFSPGMSHFVWVFSYDMGTDGAVDPILPTQGIRVKKKEHPSVTVLPYIV